MSKNVAVSLASHFAGFAGDKAARVAIVADALVAAVIMAGVHGQQGPLVEALTSLSTLKGQARAVEALRQGMHASGLTLSANGKTVQAQGLRIGKTSQEAAETLAADMGDRFTIAAGLVLSASVDKPAASGFDKACKALALLGDVDTRDLMKALRTNDGAALLARIALAQVSATKEADKVAAKAKGEITDDAAPAPAPADAPATV